MADSNIKQSPTNRDDLVLPKAWTEYEKEHDLEPVSLYAGTYQYAENVNGDSVPPERSLESDRDPAFVSTMKAILGEDLFDLAERSSKEDPAD